MKKSTLLCFLACVLLSSSFRAFPAELDWVKVAPSGKSIIFTFKDDQGGDGAGVASIASHPTITINDSQPLELTEPIYVPQYQNNPPLPYIIYPLFGTVLKAEDKVTVSAPENWAVCKAGPVGPLQNVPVDNEVGKSLYPPPPDHYTMPLGFNINPEGWTRGAYRANLFRAANNQYVPRDTPLDADGLPITINDSTTPIMHVSCSVDSIGNYTLMWDGKGQLKIISPQFTQTSETLTGGKDNIRVYTVTKSSNWHGIYLSVKFVEPDVHHIRLYPPGIKTDGSQYFLPQYLQMMRGARCLRFMQGMVFITDNLTSYDQLQADHQEIQQLPTKLTADIIRVSPYDNKENFLFPYGRAVFKFTTAQPHQLKTGYDVTVSADATLPTTDGKTCRLTGVGGRIYVLSPTEFAAAAYVGGNGPAVTAKQDQEIKGTVTVSIRHGDMWPSEMVDLVNAIDGCDMWIAVPDMMDDEGVAKLFDYIGKRLKKGRKVHVEYSNEVWNFGAPQWTYCMGMAELDPDPNVKSDPSNKWHAVVEGERWYAKRSSQVQGIARDEFQKLGRPNDILGVVCTQMGNGSIVDEILKYARAANVTFDEFGFAPYFDVGPNGYAAGPASDYEKSLLAVLKKLDVDQVCDMADMRNLYTDRMTSCVEALKRADFQGKLVCYEGGAETASFNGEEKSQQIKISEGWANHPRIGPWLRYFFQKMQNDGVSLFSYFCLDQGAGVNMWGIYPYRWDQVDGKGDGSDGLFNNLSDLQSDRCVSVKGYWCHDWLDHLNQKSSPESKQPVTGP